LIEIVSGGESLRFFLLVGRRWRGRGDGGWGEKYALL